MMFFLGFLLPTCLYCHRFSEGFPNVVLESLSCGVPVVTTNFGCAKELVTDDNGLVCCTRSPEALAQCIEHVSTRAYDKDRIQMDAFHRFGLEKICKEYEKILLEFYEK